MQLTVQLVSLNIFGIFSLAVFCLQIPLLCQDEAALENAGGSGAVEECLKLAMEQNRITNIECMEHVAEIVETQQADIHADPILHQACAIDDAKFCAQHETGKREFSAPFSTAGLYWVATHFPQWAGVFS